MIPACSGNKTYFSTLEKNKLSTFFFSFFWKSSASLSLLLNLCLKTSQERHTWKDHIFWNAVLVKTFSVFFFFLYQKTSPSQLHIHFLIPNMYPLLSYCSPSLTFDAARFLCHSDMNMHALAYQINPFHCSQFCHISKPPVT